MYNKPYSRDVQQDGGVYGMVAVGSDETKTQKDKQLVP